MDFIRLLTPEDDIAKRTSVEDLAKFHQAFSKIAEDVLGKGQMPCKVLVQFKCAPSGHTVEIRHQPKDIDEKPLKELHEAPTKLDKLPVKEKTVEFRGSTKHYGKEEIPRSKEMTELS